MSVPILMDCYVIGMSIEKLVVEIMASGCELCLTV